MNLNQNMEDKNKTNEQTIPSAANLQTFVTPENYADLKPT